MFNKIKTYVPKEVEEDVLKFWNENRIFQKSVERGKTRDEKSAERRGMKKARRDAEKGQKLKAKSFTFYDGPPFATGLPHYGHILQSIVKDVIPRYQTMKGFKVERRWGWDCHGLPVENVIEQDLGLKSKKDIEKIGIDKFNQAAKNRVLSYADDWKKIIPRIGRWVDMENDYKTMDANYTESVLWVFKSLYDKGLVYEGYKSMHICPRCGTTLSNFEVSQNYKDIDDISVFVKAELVEQPTITPLVGGQQPTTYLLAWTTTPWTLPGNVALAINEKIIYVKIKKSKLKNQNDNLKLKNDEYYILAKERLNEVLKGEEYEIVEEFKGKDLVGKQYKPIFDYYYNDKNIKNRENGWKVYAGDFVTAEDGTGIVHIAPAFGEDDMKLAQKENLPFIQHVAMDGKFNPEVKDFPGFYVKPKENPQQTDIEILKWLAHNNKLFSKQKISHSYPHCWRCDTPLLNYATSSWFVKVTDLKNKKGGLLENNKKINWVPKYVGEGRFGNWLADARDWAVSRSRFWGAPLPIWKCMHANSAPSVDTFGNANAPMRKIKGCGAIKVVGSVKEIKENVKKSGNKYFVMRHGQAESNAKNFVSGKVDDPNRLTKKGQKEVSVSAGKLKKLLKKENIDVVFSSDFSRTKETAELAVKYLSLDVKVIFDERLREINFGELNGKSIKEYGAFFSSPNEKFFKAPQGGETLIQVKKRVGEFLYEIEKKYSGKNILMVSHDDTIWQIFSAAAGVGAEGSIALKKKGSFIKTGEIKKLGFSPIPHNEDFELDFHRPYIDEVEFECENCGGDMKRIPDVFDCWFESGSMPYAQAHYPFENKKEFESNFPAEFIGEAIDQTRGWFYTLLVLSTGLFGKSAFKNVVVSGIILAEDGQKMSKRLKNYPDPMEVVNKYGADALRLFILSSPVVHAENLNFSEKGVDEFYKKTILRLWNVYSFYSTYAIKKEERGRRKEESNNVLDQWILVRLNQLKMDTTKAMEGYELDKAVKPISEFVDDLSVWYLRRSRRRLQKSEDKKDFIAASQTLGFVLSEFSKVAAPFIPFMAEALYKSLTNNQQPTTNNSVHLEEWPKFNQRPTVSSQQLIQDMIEIRRLASLALAKRAELGIRVRQPLASLKVKSQMLNVKGQKELLNILADEINVKEIVFDLKINNEIELDSNITPELKEEGMLRDFVRIIQDLRQEAGLNPSNRINLFIEADKNLELVLDRNKAVIKKEVGLEEIDFKKTDKFNAEIQTKFEGENIWVGIRKL